VGGSSDMKSTMGRCSLQTSSLPENLEYASSY
jgi:hypothetical protein